MRIWKKDDYRENWRISYESPVSIFGPTTSNCLLISLPCQLFCDHLQYQELYLADQVGPVVQIWTPAQIGAEEDQLDRKSAAEFGLK